MFKSPLGFALSALCIFHAFPRISATADITIITPNFYDTNYHDDGHNHLRQAKALSPTGPTAESSRNSISIINPYTASSTNNEASYKPSQGPFMTIVDHYYGPNGEEKVQYSNPSNLNKEDLEQLLTNLGPKSSYLPTNNQHTPSNSPSYSPAKHVMPPTKYGGGAPLSSLYKPASSHSSGFSLPSLYKSTDSYKPATTFRPAFSTIYKDPSVYSKPFAGNGHYNKGDYTKDSLYSPSYHKKEPILLHSPKEPGYKPPPSYYSDAPKSINDAILSDSYPKTYSFSKGAIESDEPRSNYYSYPPSHSQSYPSSHHHLSLSHQESTVGGDDYSVYNSPSKLHNSPSVTIVKDDYGLSYGKGSLKAGFHALPVKYSSSSPSSEYGAPVHHETFSSGFGGGYSSSEDPESPYSSRPSTKLHSSSSSGHSLSSLYEPMTIVDEVYSNPKVPYYDHSRPPGPPGPLSLGKPAYGPPTTYTMAYGAPVEYHMGGPPPPPPPPKGYITSSSPYGSSGPPGLSPKYKGPYRQVNSGPGPLYGYGYGYGKSQSHGAVPIESAEGLIVKSTGDGILLAKDKYDDEPKYKPLHLPPQLHHQHHLHSVPPPPPPRPSPHYDHGARHHHHRPLPPPPHHHHHRHHHSSHRAHHDHEPDMFRKSRDYNHYDIITADDIVAKGSDEVVNIHFYEKGFFDKEERLKKKTWRPVSPIVVKEQFSPGGHGSASIERDGNGNTDNERIDSGRIHSSNVSPVKVRPPPPSRRKPAVKSNRRPYHHNSSEDDDDKDNTSKRLRDSSNNEEDRFYDGPLSRRSSKHKSDP